MIIHHSINVLNFKFIYEVVLTIKEKWYDLLKFKVYSLNSIFDKLRLNKLKKSIYLVFIESLEILIIFNILI